MEERHALGQLVSECKDTYEKALKESKLVRNKNGKWVSSVPRDGFISKAVRLFYENLRNKDSDEQIFTNAYHLARRCLKEYKETDYLEEPDRKRRRKVGGGRKKKAPEVREALYEWFIDVRGVLKARLPIRFLILKAKELHCAWLEQQPDPNDPNIQLKFSRHWVYDWMAEFQVIIISLFFNLILASYKKFKSPSN